MGCRGQPASPWSAPRAAGESLLLCLQHLLALLRCLQSCFSRICSLYSSGCCCTAVLFPSLICYPTTTVADGLSCGQLRVHLGAGCRWLCQTYRKLLAASHRSHPCSSPGTKILLCKPNTNTRKNYCQPKWTVIPLYN